LREEERGRGGEEEKGPDVLSYKISQNRRKEDKVKDEGRGQRKAQTCPTLTLTICVTLFFLLPLTTPCHTKTVR